MASGLSAGTNSLNGSMESSPKREGQSTTNQGQTNLKHVVSVKDLSRSWLMTLIEKAELLRQTPRPLVRERLAGAMVATLFYEPSTRTRMSFEAALTRLGGSIIGAENALENSSAKKGETLSDVFRVVGSYVDAIVIRHHETDAVAQASIYSPVPVISAGTGSGEHPTQAMLDMYTLWREYGHLDGLKITVVGDLKYGRTVHSLLQCLTWFEGVQVTLISPKALSLPSDMLEQLRASGLDVKQGKNFHEALKTTDVVYQTRIQTERLVDDAEAQAAKDYSIGLTELGLLLPHARILHPLPRVGEIDPSVDQDHRAAYFRQVENGLYMRMALLDELLGGVAR